eukprot:TRINITY_DN4965_c0_g1_i1.p2 TRINITY_DN4965_c0_g1~~TRINITY_DN4965_c0_g1_i1.p2  ORF type:complete len:263 (-),score=51.80 TRINITY_DN4965_c0_g1_i1:627-1415(-)
MKILQEDADIDDDIAKLLNDADNDPDKVREKMQQEQSEMPLNEMLTQRSGVEIPVTVKFREINPFRLWVWLEGYREFGLNERDMLNTLFQSWFMIGKMGGFNSMNLQCFQNSDTSDLSFFHYDSATAEQVLQAFSHSISDVEVKDEWARCCVDLGTSDELGMDILINTILGLSQQFLGIKTLILGGENENWPVPQVKEEADLPKATMDPMQIDRLVETQQIGGNGLPDMRNFSIIDREADNESSIGGNPLDDVIKELKRNES